MDFIAGASAPIQNRAARYLHESSSRSVGHVSGTAIVSPTAGAELGPGTLRQACYQARPGSAMCVQNFDDSRGFAVRITYRISLRSSSLWEPRHPLLKVVTFCQQSAV